jgi:predicted dehydrogenase
LVEQLTLVLDLARVLVGDVDAVWGAGSRGPDSPGDVDDATAIAARFASGAVGTFTASSLLPAKRRAALETVSADGLRLELSEPELVVERPGAEPEVLTPAVDGHEAVDREFLEAVAGERASTRVPYEEAWATHRLGLAMAAAAGTGTQVRP